MSIENYEFRAIDRYTNKWVYGHYYYEDGVHYIHPKKPENSYPHKALSDMSLPERMTSSQPIIPETVSYFTGIKDRHGKKIYEGDKYQWKHEHGEIVFKDAMFVCQHESGCEYYLKFLANEIEIIGNIHQMVEKFIHNHFGYCYYDIQKNSALIYNLYVYPEHRKKGKAKKLLKLAIDEIRSEGYGGEIEIEVAPFGESSKEDCINIERIKLFYISMGLKIYEKQSDNA